jgi:flagellar assembly protein FliH
VKLSLLVAEKIMKSSSKILRTNELTEAFQQWDPDDFGQEKEIPTEMIHASMSNLFGVQDMQKKEPKKNLFKVGSNANNFQQWQPLEMDNTFIRTQNITPQPWIPFIEKPNPRKIAEKIIEDAQIKANEILNNAQVVIEQRKQDAYDQGIEKAKAELKEALQAATAIINVAREWRADMMNQAEPMIMDLVKKMAQKMFGEGIVLDNATLQQHFASVLESARSLDDLRIYMNPMDAKELGPDWREYQASLLGHKVEIVSNESIKRGGCYIQGEWGTADALVETQLTTILNQFSEVEKPETEEE